MVVGRTYVTMVVVLLVVATVAPGALPAPAHAAGTPPVPANSATWEKVIVQKLAPGDGRPESAVRRLGGRVVESLPIVSGFAAELPAAASRQLASTPGVKAVTPDATVSVQGSLEGDARASVHPQVVRADSAWRQGATGRGVTVALVDTGVAPVADLAGRVVPVTDALTGDVSPCVNLSGESSCGDSYGYGTFMAGLIAGNGASSGGAYRGIAPDARLVSIKIAGRDGSADVSNVLAAIQWVVSFRARYGIGVLNLSLGTDATQSYKVDPLNYAVERAWASGVTVVVSASNRGPARGTVAKPGDDPWVVTVGATDDRGTVGIGDDRLPQFTAHGPTAADGLAKPDVVAPGANLVSLRAPGSAIDTRFPSTMGGGYRRGSGTSMSAAVASGAAALLLDADPAMSPDRVKFALAATARPAASHDRMAVGSGQIDVAGALSAPPGQANVGLVRSSGRGSLDASRGTVRVRTDGLADTLVGGLHTSQLLLWDPVGYTTGDWTAPSWYTSNWYLFGWYGTRWYGSNWQGSNWQGSTWYGELDQASTYGSNWQGSTWYGAWGG
jgi:serine protease AprX